MASSVPPASAPAATAGPGPGFGFASKTKKKHFVQQKVKVFRAADPLVGVFLWGVAHSVRTSPSPSPQPSAPALWGVRVPSRCHPPAALLWWPLPSGIPPVFCLWTFVSPSALYSSRRVLPSPPEVQVPVP